MNQSAESNDYIMSLSKNIKNTQEQWRTQLHLERISLTYTMLKEEKRMWSELVNYNEEHEYIFIVKLKGTYGIFIMTSIFNLHKDQVELSSAPKVRSSGASGTYHMLHKSYDRLAWNHLCGRTDGVCGPTLGQTWLSSGAVIGFLLEAGVNGLDQLCGRTGGVCGRTLGQASLALSESN